MGADARRRPRRSVAERSLGALDDVASLDHDRIIRAFLGVIQATTAHELLPARRPVAGDRRTSAYVYASSSTRQKVPDLPAPRPMFEIWVYSPRVEGVHLRFGKVARGGLRWSDRREDFRTEVLGLVKAQMVKNAVIVPTGSKGGFYAKQLPDPTVDREAWLAEGIAAYKLFISGLLDVTDNRVARQAVAAAARRAPRRGRPLPRRRGRQGHGDVLRHRQRGRRSPTGSGSTTRSPRAARPATTTRPWASPPAARGSRSSGTSARWASTPRRRTSPWSASAT